jgi:hypothetical protein
MEGEDNYSDILFNLNRCSLVDFNGSEYASYRTASDMERYLAIDNYYLHHAHEADPTAQTRPSLHIETQGIVGCNPAFHYVPHDSARFQTD